MTPEAIVYATADALDAQAQTLQAQARALRAAAEATEPAVTVSRALSIEKVCELLDCGETLVRSLVARRELVGVRLSSHALRVDEASVAAFIKRRKR